jgi:LPS O-antigen subunit length determinant protein (WzzB/FepE family)
MKTKNNIQNSDSVNISELVISIWKNKTLIIFLALLGLIIGFLYASTVNTALEFRSIIKIKPAGGSIFSNYEIKLKKIIGDDSVTNTYKYDEKNYQKEFYSNIISLKNLENFINKNKNIDEFKTFLKEQGLKNMSYFTSRFGQETNDNGRVKLDSFYLIYPKVLNGDLFLRDYINYVINLSISQFQLEKKAHLNTLLEIYEKNLEIAKKLKIVDPLTIKGMNSNIYVPEHRFYYEGIKVLTLKIGYLKNFINDLDQELISYNPIASDPISVPYNFENPSKYPVIGFFMGIIISLIFISGRDIIKD